MTGPHSHSVNWAEIRETAHEVTDGSHAWSSALTPICTEATPTFGTDGFAQLAATFHGRTHTRSMDYYREVGKATADVGLALDKMANLYEAVEKNAVDRAQSVAAALLITAEVGLL